MGNVLVRTQLNTKKVGSALGMVLFLISAAPARSSSVIFTTSPGALVTGSPVDAEADFILDSVNHTITITLLNHEVNPQRDFQALSSIQVTISNLSGGLTPGVNSSSFSGIDVSSGSAPVSHPGLTNVWTAAQSTATNLIFCTNCPGGGNTDLLIGAPDPVTGTYHGGNTGLYNKTPFLLATGGTYTTGPFVGLISKPTWVLSVPQLTASSTITAVTFGFGTAWGSNTSVAQQQTSAAPEPGGVSLALGGCLMIGFSAFSRQRRLARVRSVGRVPAKD